MLDTVLPWLREPLARALGHPGHALLIHGPSGVGQFELGLALARARLCEAADGASKPCERCAACHLVQQRSHPDLLLLLPPALAVALGWQEPDDRKAKPSKEIAVAAVREAIAWSQQTPSRGRDKVVVVSPAEAMNAVTANALLKTLEEPPPSLRLVLCTSDPELLLPTIRSRCQKLRLDGPGADAALAWLESQGQAGAAVLLAAAGGRPLEALALAADGLDAARWQRLPKALAQGDTTAVAGLPVPRLVQTLQKLCHDAMALAAGGAPRYFPAGSLPAPASWPLLNAWADELRRIARHDEHPWHAPLLVEALVTNARKALAPASAPASRARAAGTLPRS